MAPNGSPPPPAQPGVQPTAPSTGARISIAEALELTRTGDVWLFRGRSVADRAIRMTTNSPVNHVGMSVVLEDLPPLLWHAELGRSLPDMWTGSHQRGVQLHDLHRAVEVWATRYGQQAWLRQLHHPITRGMEDAVLRTIARLDGTPFPSTARLASRWLRGRFPFPKKIRRNENAREGGNESVHEGSYENAQEGRHKDTRDGAFETAFCAEVVAVTYEAMGLLPKGRRPSWYDPGRFWSGDRLPLSAGTTLGGEIAVDVAGRGGPT